MNLRIVPAVQSSPTVIFSLNWHNLPASLPLPNFYSNQFAACQEANIAAPRNTLALDKAVGFHLLLESVTFDLARGVVTVSWLDKRVQEWAIEDVQGLQGALEDVLDCVRQSGEEADKEKKAAAAAAAQAKLGHSQSASVSDTTSTASSSAAHKRHRTASGIFSSLVASFITPPSSPDPNAPAQLYRARRSKTVSGVVPLIHKQNIFHPANKRESFPSNAVPQSRFLRRQARAKLVDVFRFYVASRLTSEMRASGIVGDELKERGILDDLDADEEDGASAPGTSGYSAAGGYVAYMARSILRNTLAEVKADDDSLSSSSEDSLLLTPTNNSDTSLPSETSSKSRPSSPKPAPGSPRRRAPTPSPQARQIRHLSSVLIGLTQKDKRSASEDLEMLEMIKERSLRRRYSLCEASPSRADASRLRCSSIPTDWTKPIVSSPLKSSEIVAENEDDDDEIVVVRQTASPEPSVPFPSEAAAPVPFPTDAAAAPVPRRTRSLPAPPPSSFEEEVVSCDEPMEEDVTSAAQKPKAAEAEDLLSTRPRRSALLASTSSSSSPASPSGGQTIALPARPPLAPIQTASSAAEESELIAIRNLPSLPSPKYTEVDEQRFANMQKQQQSFPQDVDEDSDEDEEGMSVSPPPSYAPSLVESPVQPFRDVDVKTTNGVVEQVRGLELDTQTAYWPHASDGIYVV